MLKEEWIADFYKKYEKVFKNTIKDMRKNNTTLSYLLFDSFKEIDKSNNDYSVIIRSNIQYDKNDFKLLETKQFVEYPNIHTYCQGITHLTTNLLAIIISYKNDECYKLQFIFNGRNDSVIDIKCDKR